MCPRGRSNGRQRQESGLRRGLTIGTLALVMALLMGGPVSTVLQNANIFTGTLVLIVVIGFAVLSDIVAIAATSADETPFNAMAAKKVPGAREALTIVRKASLVNSICADVIGDIAGTISGVVATPIILAIADLWPSVPRSVITTVVISLVAFLTVGSKASEKSFAVKASTRVILVVGRAIYYGKSMVLMFRRRLS